MTPNQDDDLDLMESPPVENSQSEWAGLRPETSSGQLIEENDIPVRREKKPDRLENILTTIIKLCIGFCIGVIVSRVIMNAQLSQLYSNQTEVSEEGEQSLEDISEKMELLQGYIDSYFLFDVDYESIAEEVYKAMLDGLDDPYSAYYTEEEYTALMESSSGSYCGIGATVTQDTDTGYVEIVSMFEGSGALEAGLEEGDMITAVDGTDISEMDLNSVVSLMKGEEDTTVEVTVYRPSTEETLSFTITRHTVGTITVAGTMLDNNIGYIVISEFDEVTVSQFEEVLNDLTEQGMEGLIVDLRDNPGGLLTAVVDIVDMLLPEGIITYTEDKYGNRQNYSSDADYNDVPMVVLVNGNSASASEIFAGAMKDYERATLVGTQTYGKGIVQTIRQLTDGSAIKLTIARYYTPNGICIHGEGITPDIVLEYDYDAVADLETVTWEDDNQVMAGYEALLEMLGE